MASAPITSSSTKLPFIITCGPTGAGKSKISELVGNLFPKYLTYEDYEHILIDDIVVKHPCYKEKVNTYFNEEIIEQLNKIKTDFDKSKLSNNNTSEFLNAAKDESVTLTNSIEKLNGIYSNIRYKIQCDNFSETCSKLERKGKIINCEQVNDEKLLTALGKKDKEGKTSIKPIILEIVGDKPFDWLFQEQFEFNTYMTDRDIKIVGFFANYQDLINRNKTRAVNDIKKYIIKDDSGYKINELATPPRLPIIDEKPYLQKVVKILQQMIEHKKRKSYDVYIYYNANTNTDDRKYNIGHTPGFINELDINTLNLFIDKINKDPVPIPSTSPPSAPAPVLLFKLDSTSDILLDILKTKEAELAASLRVATTSSRAASSTRKKALAPVLAPVLAPGGASRKTKKKNKVKKLAKKKSKKNKNPKRKKTIKSIKIIKSKRKTKLKSKKKVRRTKQSKKTI